MSDLAVVAQHFDALKTASARDVHVHVSQALPPFRFLPKAERRALADSLYDGAHAHIAAAPAAFACALLFRGLDHFMNEEFETALPIVARARTMFAEHGDREGIGLCAMLVGAIYRTFGNFDLAIKTCVEGYELLKASGRYPIFVAASANTLANIDIELGHLDEAMAMFKVTLDESAKADDFYFAIYGLHGLARVHRMQGRSTDAEGELRRALEIAEKHQNPLQTSNSLTELATLQFEMGDLDGAESLTLRALDIRERNHLLAGAVTNCLRLGDIHGKRGRWDDALAVLQRALAIAEETHLKPKLAQVHEQLSIAYEHLGDAVQTLEHYKRFHELREQVAREDGARKLADAKLVFEAEQTKKENAVIRAQKAEIERKNVELQDTIDELTRARISRKARALTFGIAIVLFVFQDAILGTVLQLMPNSNYFLLLGVKMAIIFSLAPISKGIEGYLMRGVLRKERERRRAAEVAGAVS